MIIWILKDRGSLEDIMGSRGGLLSVNGHSVGSLISQGGEILGPITWSHLESLR